MEPVRGGTQASIKRADRVRRQKPSQRRISKSSARGSGRLRLACTFINACKQHTYALVWCWIILKGTEKCAVLLNICGRCIRLWATDVVGWFCVGTEKPNPGFVSSVARRGTDPIVSGRVPAVSLHCLCQAIESEGRGSVSELRSILVNQYLYLYLIESSYQELNCNANVCR